MYSKHAWLCNCVIRRRIRRSYVCTTIILEREIWKCPSSQEVTYIQMQSLRSRSLNAVAKRTFLTLSDSKEEEVEKKCYIGNGTEFVACTWIFSRRQPGVDMYIYIYICMCVRVDDLNNLQFTCLHTCTFVCVCVYVWLVLAVACCTIFSPNCISLYLSVPVSGCLSVRLFADFEWVEWVSAQFRWPLPVN